MHANGKEETIPIDQQYGCSLKIVNNNNYTKLKQRNDETAPTESVTITIQSVQRVYEHFPIENKRTNKVNKLNDLLTDKLVS